MKIQCDVCSKKEASVFCTADEAALCVECDQRVHHANKLASKHDRVSLLHPSSSDVPLCDICQVKRAIVFCQQDRAIMCRECELPLHTANEHTQKHNRFLLTGIKLVSHKVLDFSVNHNNNNNNTNFGCDPVPDFKSAKIIPTSVCSSEISSSSPAFTKSGGAVGGRGGGDGASGGGGGGGCGVISCVSDKLVSGGSTSSISEYLIETLPGWHFEDLLLDSAYGLSKSGKKQKDYEGDEEDVLSFLDVEVDKKKLTSFSTTQNEKFGIWVPQAPAAAATSTTFYGEAANYYYNPNGLVVQGTKQQETSVNSLKVNRKLRKDDGFTVPQIQSVGSKRARSFW